MQKSECFATWIFGDILMGNPPGFVRPRLEIVMRLGQAMPLYCCCYTVEKVSSQDIFSEDGRYWEFIDQLNVAILWCALFWKPPKTSDCKRAVGFL